MLQTNAKQSKIVKWKEKLNSHNFFTNQNLESYGAVFFQKHPLFESACILINYETLPWPR